MLLVAQSRKEGNRSIMYLPLHKGSLGISNSVVALDVQCAHTFLSRTFSLLLYIIIDTLSPLQNKLLSV
jgi:hypothetical protein